MDYWNTKANIEKYLDGVRGALPLVEVQIDTIFRVIRRFSPQIKAFLDLGCGDGFLGDMINGHYPEARGVFTDLSEEMIAKTRQNVRAESECIVLDFAKEDWYKTIKSASQFDLVVSRFAIHHLEDKRKKKLYRDIYQILNPKGIFLNMEHVSSASVDVQKLWKELFFDGLLEYHRKKGDGISRETIIERYTDHEHEKANRLLSVDQQCQWLREIGYQNVDCYFRIFELALFGGTKGG
jgi:tRNA (cmo5U34)-methyltransferase